eukprot:gene52275-21496_t
MAGWGHKLGGLVGGSWGRRFFAFSGNFVVWFLSDRTDARCLGCYYLPGASLLRGRVKGRD